MSLRNNRLDDVTDSRELSEARREYTETRFNRERGRPREIYRELGILTRPARLNPISPGHAMITISSAGVGEEAWGLNPSGVTNEFEKGNLGDYNRVAIVPITESQYQSIKERIKFWQGQSYFLILRDCTSFVHDVLTHAGLNPPSDSLWPSNLGRSVERQYGTGGVRCISIGPEE